MTVIKFGDIEIDTATLTEEDMPNEICRELFTLCGVDVVMSLIMTMPGNLIQVPTRGFATIEKKLMLKEYDGSTASIRRMARSFKTTESHIRNVLKEAKVDIPCENQSSIPGLYDDNGELLQ